MPVELLWQLTQEQKAETCELMLRCIAALFSNRASKLEPPTLLVLKEETDRHVSSFYIVIQHSVKSIYMKSIQEKERLRRERMAHLLSLGQGYSALGRGQFLLYFHIIAMTP